MRTPSILDQLVALEQSLITPATRSYAYPTYAGSATRTIAGRAVTALVLPSGRMVYRVDGKPTRAADLDAALAPLENAHPTAHLLAPALRAPGACLAPSLTLPATKAPATVLDLSSGYALCPHFIFA